MSSGPGESEANDWRSGLTRRAIAKRRQGRPIAIRGGPRLGKRFLAERIRGATEARAASILILDEPGAEVPPGAFEIPLMPIPRHHVLRLFDDAIWNATAGHPFLIEGALTDRLEAHREILRDSLEPYRQTAPAAFDAWERARRFEGTPPERYRALRDFLDDSKSALDQASLLGLLNRSMFGDAAGVVAVPI
ncbi:MAG: hypothetical protein AAF735_01600 [Myxococcota bacterium]